MRNEIGFHYDARTVCALVAEQFTEHATAEMTAAQVGAFGRMADPLVFGVLNALAGGDLLEGGPVSTERIGQALDTAGRLTTVVDELVESLLRRHLEAISEHSEGVIEISSFLREAKEEVDAAREKAASTTEGRTT